MSAVEESGVATEYIQHMSKIAGLVGDGPLPIQLAEIPVASPVGCHAKNACRAAVQQPQVQSQLLRAGLEPTGLDAAAAARKLREERDFWRPIVEASGFKSED